MQPTSKRKFSDEQIKSLEFIFESDSRPQSKQKQQLATDLGLQPQQVAVWFQNRRARSKNKQIELDYYKLRESYDTLASSYESLKQENRLLLVQLQKLKTALGKFDGDRNKELDHLENCGDGKSKNGDTTTESKEAPNSATLLPEHYDHTTCLPYIDDKNGKIVSTREDTAVMNMEGHRDSSGNCGNFKSSSTSEWWEFWS